MAKRVGNLDWFLPFNTWRWSSKFDRCTTSTSGEKWWLIASPLPLTDENHLFNCRPLRKTASFHSSNRLLCHRAVASQLELSSWPCVFVSVAFYWVSYDHNLILMEFPNPWALRSPISPTWDRLLNFYFHFVVSHSLPATDHLKW